MTPSTVRAREPVFLFLAALAARIGLLFITDNNCTDGMARYEIAAVWANEPASLPSAIWLPMHFWLLGSLQWLWPGEMGARFATALFGAATVLPLYGISRAAFGRDVALYATLTYALLGIHLAYSVCSSSEGPTLFFLLTGIYCWTRYRDAFSWRWLLTGGAALSAASLCRFEPWLMIAAASAALLIPRSGRATWPGADRWAHAAAFGFAAGLGAIGWLVFSTLEWGDPFAAPNRTFVQNATDLLKFQHSLGYRLAVVPAALFISLGPFIALCAPVGAFQALRRPQSLPAALLLLLLVGGGAHVYSAITRDVTQARYTLMYGWLLVPLAFEGLGTLVRRISPAEPRRAFAWMLAGCLAWQGALSLGAHRGPAPLADKLAVVSATMPLGAELRDLIAWLQDHVEAGDTVILDDFNYDHVYIVRDALAPENVLVVPRGERDLVEKRLGRFVEQKRPKFLVYCETGQLGVLWGLGDDAQLSTSTPPLSLDLLWEGPSYRVYGVESPEPG